MSFYEGIKDALKIAQQMDNVTLIKQLLDLGEQALDMQEEIRKLKEENAELKKAKNTEDNIVHHKSKEVDNLNIEYPYITLKNDEQEIRYCAICWGREHKLIPLYDELNCLNCNR